MNSYTLEPSKTYYAKWVKANEELKEYTDIIYYKLSQVWAAFKKLSHSPTYAKPDSKIIRLCNSFEADLKVFVKEFKEPQNSIFYRYDLSIFDLNTGEKIEMGPKAVETPNIENKELEDGEPEGDRLMKFFFGT